jgi:hypothetical protein
LNRVLNNKKNHKLMKISQIKISNISTFPYIKHFSDKQGVVFDTKERNNLNILI